MLQSARIAIGSICYAAGQVGQLHSCGIKSGMLACWPETINPQLHPHLNHPLWSNEATEATALQPQTIKVSRWRGRLIKTEFVSLPIKPEGGQGRDFPMRHYYWAFGLELDTSPRRGARSSPLRPRLPYLFSFHFFGAALITSC